MSDPILSESPGLDPDPVPVCSRISANLGRSRMRPSLPRSATPIPYTGGIDMAQLV